MNLVYQYYSRHFWSRHSKEENGNLIGLLSCVYVCVSLCLYVDTRYKDCVDVAWDTEKLSFYANINEKYER